MERQGVIYAIEASQGKKTGWKYIGKSRNWKNRLKSHKSDFNLDRNSPKLQNYYNKYGKEALKINVIFRCPINELDFWEKFFIKCFDSKENGFNCTDGGDGTVGFNMKKCTLQNMVTDEIVTCNSIKEFAEKYNLDDSTIAKVLNGGLNRTFDWFCPDNKWRPTIYTVISPLGEECKVLEYKQSEFCRKHGLLRHMFNELLHDKRNNHHGWTKPNFNTKRKTGKHCRFILINPAGEKIYGINATKFAHEHGLKPYMITNLLNGHKSKKHNWKLFEEKVLL